MKKSIMIIALALVPFLMKAQMPMGMPMGMGMGAPAMMQDLPEQTITEQTDKMVEELGLDDNQGAQLLELNKQYLGKITYPVVLPPEAEKAMNEAANEANKTDMAAMAEAFNNMTSEDREKMMSSMQDMENMMAQFRGTKSEHAISMLTMLRFAIGYHRLNNMGQLQCIIRKLKDHPYFFSNPCIFRRN